MLRMLATALQIYQCASSVTQANPFSFHLVWARESRDSIPRINREEAGSPNNQGWAFVVSFVLDVQGQPG